MMNMKDYFAEELNKWAVENKSMVDVFGESCRRYAREWPEVKRPKGKWDNIKVELDPLNIDIS